MLINQADSVRALRAVHGCFFLAQLPLALGIVGPGEIGATLLRQLHEQAQVGQPPAVLWCPELESRCLDRRACHWSCGQVLPAAARAIAASDGRPLLTCGCVRQPAHHTTRMLALVGSPRLAGRS